MDDVQQVVNGRPVEHDWHRCIRPNPTGDLQRLMGRGYVPEVVVSRWLPEPRVSVVYRSRDGTVASACDENCPYPPTDEQLSTLFWQATRHLCRDLDEQPDP